MNLQPTDRYRPLVRSRDPQTRRAAQRQLDRLQRYQDATAPSSGGRWLHVPLLDLFIGAGNRLYPRASGQIDSGHEPIHGSRSGRCVVISQDKGLW